MIRECPYCEGHGSIPPGQSGRHSESSGKFRMNCSNCQGTGRDLASLAEHNRVERRPKRTATK